MNNSTKTKMMLVFASFSSIVFNVHASIGLSFPNSNGTGTYGTIIYHCRDNPTIPFTLNIQVVSPNTGSGSTKGQMSLWSGNIRVYTLPHDVVAPNDGSIQNFSWTIPENEFLGGKNLQMKIEWQNSFTESTDVFFLISKSVTMSIEGQGADNLVV